MRHAAIRRVRKCLGKKKWSAMFQFSDSKRVTIDGPARASRAAAEKDRQLIAGAMSLQPGSSRVEAASAAIKGLRSGKFPALQAGPGSASTIRDIGADELSSMSWAQLRKLANQTVGITQKRIILSAETQRSLFVKLRETYKTPTETYTTCIEIYVEQNPIRKP